MAIWQEPPEPAPPLPKGGVTPSQPPPPRPDATPTHGAAPTHSDADATPVESPPLDAAPPATAPPDAASEPLRADPLLLATERTPLVAPTGGPRWPRSAQLAVGALTAAVALLLTFGGAYWLGRSTNDTTDAAGSADNQDQQDDVEVQGQSQTPDPGDTSDTTNADDDQSQDPAAPDDQPETTEPAAPVDEVDPDTPDTDTDSADPADTPDPDTSDPATPATPDTDSADPAATPDSPNPTDSTDPVADLPFVAADEPVRSATYRDGQVTLSGRVPSQEIADEIAEKAAAVVGADNVIVEYEIDPEAPVPDSAPLYVQDYVLFDPASDEIGPDFEPILNLGIVVLTTFPDVTVTVIGHTDDVGPDDENLALSQQRIDRILEFWTERGIPPEQLQGEARGESDPIADNSTPEGRQQNRRVEFIIAGLLD